MTPWRTDADGWNTKGGKKGGKGGAGGTFLQKALEGAVVSALGLADFGSAGGKSAGWGKGTPAGGPKGGGKGGGKGGAGDVCTPCCAWDDCVAGAKQQATWGGGPNCFRCKRPFGQQPPLEKLAQWAWDKKFQSAADKEKGKEAEAEVAGKATKGKGKGKGAGGKSKPEADVKSVAQLAALRTERLAALKTGVAIAVDAAPAQTSPIKEAMAAHLVDPTAAPPSTVTLDKQLLEQLQVNEAKLKEVVASFLQEKHPPTQKLLSAEEVCAKLMKGVASSTSVESREAAEKLLKATEHAITALLGGGATAENPGLRTLLQQKETQIKEVTRLKEKAPSLKLRRLDLIRAQDTHQRTTQEGVDWADKGKAKAEERAKERTKLMDFLERTLIGLKMDGEEKVKVASEEHDARAAEKNAMATEVQELLVAKIAEVDAEMVVDAEEDGDEEFEDEEPTATENNLEEVKLQLARAQQTNGDALRKAQAATESALAENARAAREEQHSKEVSEIEQQRDAAASESAHLKSQAQKLEDRLQKLEEALAKADQRELDAAKAAEEQKKHADAAAAVGAPAPAAAAPPSPKAAKQAWFQKWALAHVGGIDIGALPQLKPSKPQLAVLSNLHWAIQKWTEEGGMMPLDMATLSANTLAGDDAPNVLKTLLGPAMDLFKEDLQSPDTVIPRQVLMLAHTALDRLREKLTKDEAVKTAAKSGYEAMRLQTRERRRSRSPPSAGGN